MSETQPAGASAATVAKVTASDIKAALMKAYAAPSHRIFFEVSNDTGTRASRWIDAVAVGIWPSTGHEVIGIEIKVSRSDWQREMKEPAKAQTLMRYCTRWYLACPDGLVKPDELPATWGMLVLKDGAIKTKVTAKLLEPDPLTPGFMMAVLRNANAVDMSLVQRLVDERDAARQSQFDERLQRELKYRASDLDGRRKAVEEVRAKLLAITGEDPTNWVFDPESLGAAYRLLKLSGLHKQSGWGTEIPGIIEQLGRAQEALTSLHGKFSDLQKGRVA